ncbi:SoxR reducing system RseC family protein [Desulfobacula sp.]|uniref:SoxR reducing system RseC family protein n=1 Tax=Desulfobacula sp. TaxID=2593537 RepID=UPI00262667D1|nr:SoxR reducing system RseC family protein [Desulfobacula sp.]
MITENGIVTNVNAATAWVKTTRSGACESCSSKETCGTADSITEMIVTVDNTLNVEKGDHVIIGLETRPMLYLTFLLYVFPIILLTIGAVIGNSLAASFQMNPSILSMIFGFSFFGLSFYFIRKKNNALANEDAYKPFLVRKKSQVIPEGCSTP